MIRELRWTDMEDLVDNYYSFYDEMESDYPDIGLIFYFKKPFWEQEVTWFTNLYRDVMEGNAVALVAVENSKVVGLCDIHRTLPGSELSHKGSLGISIRKDFRGKGIGKELVSTAIEKARGKYELIVLGVFSTNEGAINLYKQLGFKEYGSLPASTKRKGRYYDEVLMYKSLL